MFFRPLIDDKIEFGNDCCPCSSASKGRASAADAALQRTRFVNCPLASTSTVRDMLSQIHLHTYFCGLSVTYAAVAFVTLLRAAWGMTFRLVQCARGVKSKTSFYVCDVSLPYCCEWSEAWSTGHREQLMLKCKEGSGRQSLFMRKWLKEVGTFWTCVYE